MKRIEFTWDGTHVADTNMNELRSSINEYTKHLQNVIDAKDLGAPEASLSVVEQDFSNDARSLGKKMTHGSLKYVIVAGIGGSNLGTKAVYDALYGPMDAFDPDRGPKLIFLDTTSPSLLQGIKDLLLDLSDSNQIIVNVISKSGGTTETIAHFEVLYQFMRERFGQADDRFVLTTDEGSNLWNAATEKMHRLAIPKKVGGRFSVFTSVGIFPLTVAGIDTDSLVRGARDMRDRCLGDENIALDSAALTLHFFEHDIRINNNFFFNPELESVGKWYRQLMGESVGKQHDAEGIEVHRGITPIVSIGSTDLHSMAQLYLGGPKDKLTTFVYVSEQDVKASVPGKLEFDLVPSIAGKSYADLMDAIINGVQAAYKKNELPFTHVNLGEISEYTIGQFLQFKMLEMMYLAKLMNLNAFDQPNVEDYKVETKAILEG